MAATWHPHTPQLSQHFEPAMQVAVHCDGVHEAGVMHTPLPPAMAWQQAHAEHAAPPVPHAVEEVPDWHRPIVSQHPVQVAEQGPASPASSPESLPPPVLDDDPLPLLLPLDPPPDAPLLDAAPLDAEPLPLTFPELEVPASPTPELDPELAALPELELPVGPELLPTLASPSATQMLLAHVRPALQVPFP